MSTQLSLNDILKCPITHERMTDPVMDSCGHTFEKADIVQWLRQTPRCPLSRKPMQESSLLPNRAIKDILMMLGDRDPNILQQALQPTNTNNNAAQPSLSSREIQIIKSVIDETLQQRATDQSAGIPAQLNPPRPSLSRRVAQTVSSNYLC